MNKAYLRETEVVTQTTPVTTEGKALEHKIEKAILVYSTPSQEPPPGSSEKSNPFKHGKQTQIVKLP